MKRDKTYYIEKAFELCVKEARGKQILKPNDIYNEILRPYGMADQEHFIVISLDGAHQVIDCSVISKGTANRTLAHPREVFRKAITKNAISIIISHNHPSGMVEPSVEDTTLTNRIVEAGKVIGISVLDHLVLGKDKFYSFQQEGMMPN